MKLFQVTEPSKPGRKPVPLEVGIDFEVGEESAHIPLVVDEESGVILQLPMDSTLSQSAQMAKAMGRKLYVADISQRHELLLVPAADPRSREAIVLISTRTCDGSFLQLTANSHTDGIENEHYGRHVHQKVVVIWNSFPPPGVELLNSEQVEIDDTHQCKWKSVYENVRTTPPLLLRMLAGSSFRIWRTGEIEDAYPEFLVSWNGKELRTIVPGKYVNMTPRQRRECATRTLNISLSKRNSMITEVPAVISEMPVSNR